MDLSPAGSSRCNVVDSMDARVCEFFPNGLRILVVDDDEESLRDIVRKLRLCKYYAVTPCTSASSALDILHRAMNEFDLILAEARTADMLGVVFLQLVTQSFQVPIISMSAERRLELVVECLDAGACHYVEKPVELAVLATVWQHVVLNNQKGGTPAKEVEQIWGRTIVSSCSATGDRGNRLQEVPAAETTTVRREGGDIDVDRNGVEADREGGYCSEKEEEMGEKNDDGDGKPRKERVVWDDKLHRDFTEAVEKLGVNQAAPRKILQLMNRPELTRSHVASHLQKYRQYLRKKAEGRHHRLPSPDIARPSYSRYPKRKSVFDPAPEKPPFVFKHQLDILPLKPRPRYADQLVSDHRPYAAPAASSAAAGGGGQLRYYRDMDYLLGCFYTQQAGSFPAAGGPPPALGCSRGLNLSPALAMVGCSYVGLQLEASTGHLSLRLGGSQTNPNKGERRGINGVPSGGEGLSSGLEFLNQLVIEGNPTTNPDDRGEDDSAGQGDDYYSSLEDSDGGSGMNESSITSHGSNTLPKKTTTTTTTTTSPAEQNVEEQARNEANNYFSETALEDGFTEALEELALENLTRILLDQEDEKGPGTGEEKLPSAEAHEDDND